jgi:hypothetical protein
MENPKAQNIRSPDIFRNIPRPMQNPVDCNNPFFIIHFVKS